MLNKLATVMVLVALCLLPQSAFAECKTYFMTLPDGKVLYCVDCGSGPICT